MPAAMQVWRHTSLSLSLQLCRCCLTEGHPGMVWHIAAVLYVFSTQRVTNICIHSMHEAI